MLPNTAKAYSQTTKSDDDHDKPVVRGLIVGLLIRIRVEASAAYGESLHLANSAIKRRTVILNC